MSAGSKGWRGAAGEFLGPPTWILGATASCYLGFTEGVMVGLAALGAAVILTLAVTRLAVGWRAVPLVLAMAALQAPAVYAAGLRTLYRSTPGMSLYFEFGRGDAAALPPFVWCLAAASLLGPLMRRPDLVARGGRLAFRLCVPAAIMLTVLTGFVTARTIRFPTSADVYFASLPLIGTMPGPDELACEPVDPSRLREYPLQSATTCSTREVVVAGFPLHYVCASSDDRGRSCVLSYRDNGWLHAHAEISFHRGASSPIEMRRDEARGRLLLRSPERSLVQFPIPGPWPFVSLYELRKEVALPWAWSLVAVLGLLTAAGCFLAFRAFRRASASRGDAAASWVRERRGDLALVALGAMTCAGAPLLAALVAGFLT